MKQPAESIAWAQWQLGTDHFTLGELEKAESYYRQSLQSYPNYYRAQAGMAQVRGGRSDINEAIDLYQKAISILPMPDYVSALGDLYGEDRETRASTAAVRTGRVHRPLECAQPSSLQPGACLFLR